jgi:hypothetical protein
MRLSTPVQTDGARRLITVQRCCNGCGDSIGDANDADLNAAVAGLPLPDVRAECATCRLHLDTLNLALADTDGQQLVQAILDRKRVC